MQTASRELRDRWEGIMITHFNSSGKMLCNHPNAIYGTIVSSQVSCKTCRKMLKAELKRRKDGYLVIRHGIHKLKHIPICPDCDCAKSYHRYLYTVGWAFECKVCGCIFKE